LLPSGTRKAPRIIDLTEKKLSLRMGSCSNTKDGEMLVFSDANTSGSIKWVNKGKGEGCILQCTFKNKEQATEYDLVGCLDEHTVKAWSTKELGITMKEVGMLAPIYQ
jgi:hypothetical protein